MNPVVSANIHFYLVIPLVFLFLKGLDTVPEYCPISCYCTLDILNCSRIGNSPGLQHVPFSKPVAYPHAFFILDFTGNDISSIGKQVWKAYPWAVHLVLKGNSLSIIQNSSLEGLLSLTHLDLSCNKIKIIQRNAFEAAPFLQFINFSGNVLEQISPGAFEAWHRMQFLFKLDLTHNPLVAIEDDHFYRLPSLKFLDLHATESTPKVVANLIQTSLQLNTLIVPNKMSCCLCHFKDHIEILNIIELDCTDSCTRRIVTCEEEESVHDLQEKLMKVLQIRKKHASNNLRIMPKKQPQHKNMTLKPRSNTNVGYLLPTLWKSSKESKKLKADMLLPIKQRDESERTKLYLLANLLQKALKEKIAKAESTRQEAKVQHDTSAQASVVVAPEDARFKKRRHLNRVKRDVWLRKMQQGKETFPRFVRSRREFARAMLHHADQPNRVHSRTQQLMKLVDDPDLQRVDSLFSHQEIPKFHPHHMPSIVPPLTASVILDDKPAELTGQVIILVNRHNKTKTRHKAEEVPSENREGVSTLSSTHEEENVEKVSKDKADYQPLMKKIFKLLRHWKHPPQSSGITKNPISYSELETTTVHPKVNILPTEDDYVLQGDLFEAAVNEKLKTLITGEPMRSLISHVIRILKMDCTSPKVQMTCAKLMSRTGVLIKLFSEQENNQGLPTQWKDYFLSVKNKTNITTAGPQIMGQEIEYGYSNKLLLAVSVTGVIIVTIAIICLIEICSQRSAAKGGTPYEKKWSFFQKASEGSLFGKSTEQVPTTRSAPGKQISFRESTNEVQNIENEYQDDAVSLDEHIYSWIRPLSTSVTGKSPSRKGMSRIMPRQDETLYQSQPMMMQSAGDYTLYPPAPFAEPEPSEIYSAVSKSSGGRKSSRGSGKGSSRGTSSVGGRSSSKGASSVRESRSSRTSSTGASSRGGSVRESRSSRASSSIGERRSSGGSSSVRESRSSRASSSIGESRSSRGGSSIGERASSKGTSSGVEELSSRASSAGDRASSRGTSSGEEMSSKEESIRSSAED